MFQSNSKYWYDREMGGAGGMVFGAGRGDAAIPRPPRARPSPYARPGFDEPQEMGYGGGAMRRGGIRGRVKHMHHGRGENILFFVCLKYGCIFKLYLHLSKVA